MIKITNLTKKYNDFTAVDGINLEIQTGEFFGLLGPNGAGKTTTIGMMSTLLLPTDGIIEIEGERLNRRRKDLKRKVSVVTQEYSMRQDMTMDQVMEYQGRLYYMPIKKIREKTNELFDFANLTEHRHKDVRHLSGGMKRKLMICRALLTEPDILLLDEPTAGMDAMSRRQMWNLLRNLNNNGLTIVLTTHYIEEAEMLCDRVALMNQGTIDGIDTPKAFISELGEFCVDVKEDEVINSRFFKEQKSALAYIEKNSEVCTLRPTTLEDVFLSRLGRRIEV